MNPYSYRRILNISFPLMFGTFVQSIVSFSDAIFVSKLGDIAIGAFGNGSLMYLTVFMFCRGLADGTQIEVAKQDGKKNYLEIGRILVNSQVFQLLISGILFVFLVFSSEFIILRLSENVEIADAMVSFLNMRGWGLFFAAQHMTLVGFFIGLGRTRIILISALIIALTNIFLDYCLIHGNFGFEAMGMVGAPLASSIAETTGFLYLLIFLISKDDLKKYAYSIKRRIDLKKYFRLIKLSFPMMLQGVAAFSTWLVFFTLVEHMGTEALETAQTIRYMYFLAFIPIYGFASATKTIMSNLVGQGRMDLVFKTQNRIILLSFVSTLLIFHGSLLYPETLVRLINQNPTISETVLNDSVFILKFISGSILLYSVAVIYFNVIAGIGKTTVYFLIELISIILYLIGCYFFIVKWNWDIKYIWGIEYIYFLGFGIFSALYLVYYRKNSLKHA